MLAVKIRVDFINYHNSCRKGILSESVLPIPSLSSNRTESTCSFLAFLPALRSMLPLAGRWKSSTPALPHSNIFSSLASASAASNSISRILPISLFFQYSLYHSLAMIMDMTSLVPVQMEARRRSLKILSTG